MVFQRAFKRITDWHKSRSYLTKGKDIVRNNDELITLLEKDDLLSKYNISKQEIMSTMKCIKEDHLSINNVIDLLKKWNISKSDEDVLIKQLNKYSIRKHVKH